MPASIFMNAKAAANCCNRRNRIAACFALTALCRARRFNKKMRGVVPDEMTAKNSRPRKWGWLVLLTSATTLVCCVIPIVLVTLGMGATVAVLYSSLPFLSFLGLHKEWTFAITALVLALAAWALFRPGRACPANPKLAKACQSADKWNRRLFLVSVLLWCISFFTAYFLLPITEWLDLL